MGPGAAGSVEVECEAAGVTVRCRRAVGFTIAASLETVAARDRQAVAAELAAVVEAVADDLEACILRLT